MANFPPCSFVDVRVSLPTRPALRRDFLLFRVAGHSLESLSGGKGSEVVNSPYGAKVDGDVMAILEGIKNGVSLYLEPLEGDPLTRNGIGLSGSLYAINQALYFCAPDVPGENAQ